MPRASVRPSTPSQVEVAWAIAANHGGGYQYRLCPTDEPLTEACFQRTPLAFEGDVQWLQFGYDQPAAAAAAAAAAVAPSRARREEVPAIRVGGGKVCAAVGSRGLAPIGGGCSAR